MEMPFFFRKQLYLFKLAVGGLLIGHAALLNYGASFSPKIEIPAVLLMNNNAIPKGLVVLETGKPGIQKTERVQQALKDSSVVPSSQLLPEAKIDYHAISIPVYPEIARKQGWEGTVILKVLVEEDGSCKHVAVEKSSGYDALDHSAVRAVKEWKFTPARLGSTSYAALTRIPIRFALAEK